MTKIVNLFGYDVSTALRNIADGIDEGKFEDTGCTVICGTDVFYCGNVDDNTAATEAIWDMTFGIHRLMAATHE